MKKNKIAILTWHYYKNFGSALQAYALQESIKGLGYNVKIIDYRDPKFGQVNRFKDNLKISINKIFGKTTLLGRRFFTSYSSFYSKYLQQTKLIQDPHLLPNACKQFDVFVCGSDQVWAPNVFNSVYMLDFVPSSKKKISYAASIGLNDLPQKYIEEYSNLLSDFDAISVRERAGAELLKEKCAISAEVVLDPTLLVSADEWKVLEETVSYNTDKYIFCYFLNTEHNYSNMVEKYAKKNGYKIIGVSANKNDNEWMQLVNIGPCEFLSLIHNASAVFTDSYHGTVFSLLYHKPLVVFERFSSDDPICQNSRIYQLDHYFGLGGVILDASSTNEINIKKLDYNEFEERLEKLRIKSLDYLSKALEK